MTSNSAPSGDLDGSSSPAEEPVARSPEINAPEQTPDVAPAPEQGGTAEPPKSVGRQTPSSSPTVTTRAAAAWFATAVVLVLLVGLVILILQNQKVVEVHYLGFAGSITLGTALLIAAVVGAASVAIVGVIRLTQLRFFARRARRAQTGREKQRR
jgi:uncharacterized integral membrane protein